MPFILESGLAPSEPGGGDKVAALEFGHLAGKYLLRNEILSELLKP